MCYAERLLKGALRIERDELVRSRRLRKDSNVMQVRIKEIAEALNKLKSK